MAQPAIPPILDPLADERRPPPAQALPRGRIRRLPNGDLVPAHRYEDEMARLRAEATASL